MERNHFRFHSGSDGAGDSLNHMDSESSEGPSERAAPGIAFSHAIDTGGLEFLNHVNFAAEEALDFDIVIALNVDADGIEIRQAG